MGLLGIIWIIVLQPIATSELQEVDLIGHLVLVILIHMGVQGQVQVVIPVRQDTLALRLQVEILLIENLQIIPLKLMAIVS